jgi:hypothetical protein
VGRGVGEQENTSIGGVEEMPSERVVKVWIRTTESTHEIITRLERVGLRPERVRPGSEGTVTLESLEKEKEARA